MMKTSSLWSLTKKHQENSICPCIEAECTFSWSIFMSKSVALWLRSPLPVSCSLTTRDYRLRVFLFSFLNFFYWKQVKIITEDIGLYRNPNVPPERDVFCDPMIEVCPMKDSSGSGHSSESFYIHFCEAWRDFSVTPHPKKSLKLLKY